MRICSASTSSRLAASRPSRGGRCSSPGAAVDVACASVAASGSSRTRSTVRREVAAVIAKTARRRHRPGRSRRRPSGRVRPGRSCGEPIARAQRVRGQLDRPQHLAAREAVGAVAGDQRSATGMPALAAVGGPDDGPRRGPTASETIAPAANDWQTLPPTVAVFQHLERGEQGVRGMREQRIPPSSRRRSAATGRRRRSSAIVQVAPMRRPVVGRPRGRASPCVVRSTKPVGVGLRLGQQPGAAAEEALPGASARSRASALSGTRDGLDIHAMPLPIPVNRTDMTGMFPSHAGRATSYPGTAAGVAGSASIAVIALAGPWMGPSVSQAGARRARNAR